MESLGGQLVGFVSLSLKHGWCLVDNYYIDRTNESHSLVRKTDTYISITQAKCYDKDRRKH